jgi:hypothetical protein
MRRLVLLCLPLSGCARQASEVDVESDPAEQLPNGEPASLMSLPDFGIRSKKEYRCDPYIRAAVRLQRLGREAAIDALGELSREEGVEGHRAIILCRMLFTKKAGGEFRRPLLGAAAFLDGTDYPDWPLEPIEVVDGVPFLIVRSYTLGGVPESSEGYLDYCVTDCEWNSVPYRVKTVAERTKALDKLTRSPKWKEAEGWRQAFLAEQVK